MVIWRRTHGKGPLGKYRGNSLPPLHGLLFLIISKVVCYYKNFSFFSFFFFAPVVAKLTNEERAQGLIYIFIFYFFIFFIGRVDWPYGHLKNDGWAGRPEEKRHKQTNKQHINEPRR